MLSYGQVFHNMKYHERRWL